MDVQPTSGKSIILLRSEVPPSFPDEAWRWGEQVVIVLGAAQIYCASSIYIYIYICENANTSLTLFHILRRTINDVMLVWGRQS